MRSHSRSLSTSKVSKEASANNHFFFLFSVITIFLLVYMVQGPKDQRSYCSGEGGYTRMKKYTMKCLYYIHANIRFSTTFVFSVVCRLWQFFSCPTKTP